MTTEQQLREKLRKITALFEGAATPGERQAAAAAMERLRLALGAAAKTQPVPEMKFIMADQWQRRLFTALCRRYGLDPYRYRGQRRTTVMLRAPDPLCWKRSGRNTWSCRMPFTPISAKRPSALFARRFTGMRAKRQNGRADGSPA